MAKKKKVPELRFKESTEEWKVEKLGEVTKVTMGQSPQGINYTSNSEDHILVQGNADMKDGHVVPRVWTTQVTKTANVDDIIISVRAPVGEVGITDYKVVLGRGVAAIAGNSFIYQSLIRMNEFGYWKRLSCGSTFDSINSSILRDTAIVIPNKKEQIKIGSYFQNLDALIAVHQRKYDKLWVIKKSMLEKMFPKDGADVPEIRFSGFSSRWEKKRLGDISFRFTDPVPTPHDGYWRLGIRSHAKGTFHDYVKPGRELETAQMHKVGANNLIVNITFAWEHAVAITDKNDAGKLVSHRFPQLSFKKGMIPEYFKFLIIDDRFRHHLWLSSPGGAGRNRVLNINEMLEYTFWVPCSAEQTKVALLFQYIDSLLALHKKELDKLKNFKKACLEIMFI